MHGIFLVFLCLVSSIRTENSTIVDSKYPWLRLPPTPQLPLPDTGKYVQINNVSIWYAIYGPSDGTPLLFLHGGLANSNYWGLQVEELKSKYRCIMMDSRGQGKSTISSDNITYDLMTSDVLALLDYLNIEKTHLVGWSDGAVIGLNIAMKYSNRLTSLFAFGANYNYSAVKDVFLSPVFTAYLERTKNEYETMNPINNYTNLYNSITAMWSVSPNWSQEDFLKIDKNLPIWIVDGDHEEAINREQPDTMTSWILQSGEMILPRTSHFAFLQDPEMFSLSIKRFLIEASCFECNLTISESSSATRIFLHLFSLLFLFF